ncbi:MAG TPA: hypothetical protein V6D19_06890, partial [Stenomitos sp.]
MEVCAGSIVENLGIRVDGYISSLFLGLESMRLSVMQGNLPPVKGRVGVIGGGQLAWMLRLAAQQLGIEVRVQTPSASDPAVAGFEGESNAVLAPVADAVATARLAEQCSVITFENEFVDIPSLSQLAAQGVVFRPSLSVLAALLDKYEQHQFLDSIGLSVPAFAAIAPTDDPLTMGFSFPLVIKSRRHGYDGQGTFIVQSA